MTILISCETGGTAVPAWLDDDHMDTDPQWFACIDNTARYCAQALAEQLGCDYLENRFSAGLVDVTRSSRHRHVFPSTTRRWTVEKRQQLINDIHQPYRDQIEHVLGQIIARFGFVVHLSVRSFPLRNGNKINRTDVGLLYNPSCEDEVDFCLDWIDEIYDIVPNVRVRRNYPRRGTTESLITAMRSRFTPPGDMQGKYIGIEMMLNQAWASRDVRLRHEAISGLCTSLAEMVEIPLSKVA